VPGRKRVRPYSAGQILVNDLLPELKCSLYFVMKNTPKVEGCPTFGVQSIHSISTVGARRESLGIAAQPHK
jgi:hypothetical protein